MSDDAGTAEDLDPTGLRHVGPSTAAVIEASSFSTADLRDGRVSVRALLEAGVNAGVVERLRREHGLPWAHRWRADGQQLARRAASMRDVPAAERRWISASGSASVAVDGPAAEAVEDPDELDGPDWPAWPDPAGEDSASAAPADTLDGGVEDAACPRCGAELSRYTLGDSVSVHCESCGYAGVPFTPADEDAWRIAVDRLLRGDHPS